MNAKKKISLLLCLVMIISMFGMFTSFAGADGSEPYYAKYTPEANILYFNSIPDLVYALQNGQVDGFLNDEPVAKYLSSHTEGLRYIDESLGEPLDTAFVFGESEFALKAQKEFNEYLAEIKENGTPEQIFDHPQKERTRRFIKHLKAYEEVIQSKDFDFLGVNTRIEEFGRKHMMDQKTIVGAQTVFEELGVQTVLPKLADKVDMRITLEYSEEKEHAQMRLFYNGGMNPLEDMDKLSRLLIDNVSVETEYLSLSDGDYSDCVKIKLK